MRWGWFAAIVASVCVAGGVFAYVEWQEATEASWTKLVHELHEPALKARRRSTALRVKVELSELDSKVRPIDVAQYDMPGLVGAAEELSAAARREGSEHTSSREVDLLSQLTRLADAAAGACRSRDTFEDCLRSARELERFIQSIQEWTLPPATATWAAPAEAG